MTVFAVAMFKDEADVAAETLQHLASEGVDGIIVADNGSTDGTRDILHGLELDCDLIVVDDPDPAYYQAEKMTRLARRAHARHGATWIVPFDADELWYSAPDRIGVVLEHTDADYVTAPLWNHFPSALDPEDHPFRSIGWRQRESGALPKVAVRWRDDAHLSQGNHGVAFERPATCAPDVLQLRHFPYRSFDQFVRKARNGAAAYAAATDLPEDMGAHWRQYGTLLDRWGEDVVRREVWERYFWHFAPVEAGLVHDPAPFMRW